MRCRETPETFQWHCSQSCVYSDKTTWPPQWKIRLENPWKCHFSDSKCQNVPRCLGPQELILLVRVPKLPTINLISACLTLASHAGVFRGAHISSLPTNACSTENNIPFPSLANHIVLSKFWKVDLDGKVI